MKYKKIMFLLVLVIFIFGATSVCASEDDSTIELSQVDADEMMSFEEGKLIGQTGNDELIITNGKAVLILKESILTNP